MAIHIAMNMEHIPRIYIEELEKASAAGKSSLLGPRLWHRLRFLSLAGRPNLCASNPKLWRTAWMYMPLFTSIPSR